MTEFENLMVSLFDFQKRSGAKKKLVALGAESVGNDLLLRLNDELPENVRWVIIDIFAIWQWEGAVDVLVDMLDEFPSLHLDLLRALKEITDLDLEADVNLWRKMLNEPCIFVDLQKRFESDEIINFTIHDSYCSIVVALPGSRRQEVLVLDKVDVLSVYTECGDIQKDQVEIIEDFNEKLAWAQLAVESGDTLKVTLTAEVTQDNISADSLKYSVKKLAELADSLEEQLTGKDKI